MNKSLKRFLAFMMAIAVVSTTVFGSDVTTAYAKAAAKAVKSVTLKIGSSNVTKKTKAVNVGSSVVVKAIVNPSSAKKSVAFKSSNTKVATVTKAGKVTAKKAGTAKITATVTGKNGKKKTAYTTIKVNNIAVKSVKLNKKSLELHRGDKAVLKATVAPSNATVKTVKWSTSDSSVVTVSKGVVSAVGVGTATVTAKSGSKSAKCTVVVADVIAVTGVTINPETVTPITVSATTALTATITPENASNKAVTWSSADPKVATVDGNGVVKGIAPGKTTIKVVTADGAFSDEREVLVTGTSNKNAASVTIDVANAIKGYENVTNTVLTGTDADIRVRVLDEDGNPVGNTQVSFASKCNEYGNGKDVFKLKNNNVLTTDADGYASFVFGEKEELSYTASDAIFESYVVTATVVGSSVSKSTDVKFGYINLEGIKVVNNHDTDPDNDIVPSDNATSGNDGVDKTYAINGCRNNEYVSSQQVSKGDTKDHQVRFSAKPELVIPATSGNKTVDDWYKAIDFTSSEYSVYNDSKVEGTSYVIEDVPAGLQYATLNFSKINLSEYTKIQIKVCYAGTDIVVFGRDGIKVYDMYSDSNTESTIGYQVPLQEDTNVDIKVSLISEGQVNDDANIGYTIKDATGVWVSDATRTGEEIELDGTVKWDTVTPLYSNRIEIDKDKNFDMIQQLIADDGESQYLKKDYAKNYHYYYQLPTFPRTGNAIITITDNNNNVKAYYVYPTINRYTTKTVNGEKVKEYKNENVIPTKTDYPDEYPGQVAILASAEEVNYSENVGTITTDGNEVIVDSNKSGVTDLRATVTITGKDDDKTFESIRLDKDNGAELYTSINWCPRPTEDDESDRFYAIQGQQVEVVAQLVDGEGNAKKEKDATVEFTYGAIKKGTNIEDSDIGKVLGNTGVSLLNGTKLKTDENGQAKLILSSASYENYIKYIQATSERYDVKISIAGQETKLADIFWVDAGVAWKDKVDTDSNHGNIRGWTYVSYTNSPATVSAKDIDARAVGTHWIFGYKVVGKTVFNNVQVLDISNIPIDVTKDSLGEMNQDGCANGVANLYSETVGSTVLTGKITKDHFETDKTSEVVFTIQDERGNVKEYKNVGTGTPVIDATLDLPISWKADGVYVSIVTPDGATLDKNVDTTAYIKIADKYGNPIANKKFSYAITGLNEKAQVEAETDANGLYAVSLANVASKWTENNSSSTITASTDDGAIVAQPVSIVYTNKETTHFGLVGAQFEKMITDENGKNKSVIKATFSSQISKLYKDLFAVANTTDGTTYKVDSVESVSADRRTVLITVDDSGAIANLNKEASITVTVTPQLTADKAADHMNHVLVDDNGKKLESGYNTVSFLKPADIKLNAKYENGVITVSATKGNDAITLKGSEVIVVSDIPSVFKKGTENVGVAKGTKNGTTVTFTATPAEKDTTVRVYYLDQVATVSVTTAK